MKTLIRRSPFLSLVLCLAFSLALAAVSGCSSAPKVEDDEIGESSIPGTIGADENTMAGDSDSGRAMGLQTVHFPYDSFVLDDAGKETLRANAEILKSNSSVNVQIEGHCDIQGGTQYNIALGEKRANAAKKFMEGLGITGGRIATISFGKERPLVPGNTDDANARNRRGNFVITSK
jgi:peptidoglycan-associated lipoprotein